LRYLSSFPTRRSSDLLCVKAVFLPQGKHASLAPGGPDTHETPLALLASVLNLRRPVHGTALQTIGFGRHGHSLIGEGRRAGGRGDRKSTRLNSSHVSI